MNRVWKQAINAMLDSDGSLRDQLKTLFRKGGGSFVAEVSAEPVRVEGHASGRRPQCSRY